MILLNKIKRIWEREKKIQLINIDFAIAVFLMLNLLLPFNPISEKRVAIDPTFNRVMGIGLANNWSVDKVIDNFNKWFFLFFMGTIIIAFILAKLRIHNLNEKNENAWQQVKNLLPIAFVSTVIRYVAFFDQEVYGDTIYRMADLWMIVAILIYSFFVWTKSEKTISYEDYHANFWISFCISFPVACCLPVAFFIGHVWLMTFLVTFVILLLGQIFAKINLKKVNMIVPASVFLCTSIFIESIYILNQRGVFVHRVRKTYFLLMLLICCWIAKMIFSNKQKKKFNEKSIMYPLLAFGIFNLSYQIQLYVGGYFDWFESANWSVLVSDFWNYGKLPIIEHYGGHMLSNVFECLLYAILNGDVITSILQPYGFVMFSITYLFFFFILKEFVGDETAFWIVLILPFHSIVGYFCFALITCIALTKFVKAPSMRTGFFVWLSCVIVSLMRLDWGAAFTFAIMLSLIVTIIKSRNYNWFKMAFTPLVIIAIMGGALFTILCLMREINVFDRLKEFLGISLSNANWGTVGMGNVSETIFPWCYIFIPILCLLGIMYLLISRSGFEKYGLAQFSILLTLGFAYFLNIHRGIVRHSLKENATDAILFTSVLFLSLLTVWIWKRKEYLIYFLAGFMLLNGVLLKKEVFSMRAPVDNSMYTMEANIGIWNSLLRELNEKVNRGVWPKEIIEKKEKLQMIVDRLLMPDETWLDFVNQSALYSLLGRECPTYADQFPGHLSGELTQELSIKQVEQNGNIPLVFMPTAETGSLGIMIDGIANNYRYYKVAEYIYQNYRPLCQTGDIAIWCRYEKYENYLKVLEEAIRENNAINIELIQVGYDESGNFNHNYQLFDLPYIWGNYDEREAWNNEVLITADSDNENTWSIQNRELDKTQGNYLLLECDNNNADDTEMTLCLGNDDETYYQYIFKIHSGKGRYLIRISNDYYWYFKTINTFRYHCENVKVSQLKILLGD